MTTECYNLRWIRFLGKPSLNRQMSIVYSLQFHIGFVFRQIIAISLQVYCLFVTIYNCYILQNIVSGLLISSIQIIHYYCKLSFQLTWSKYTSELFISPWCPQSLYFLLFNYLNQESYSIKQNQTQEGWIQICSNEIDPPVIIEAPSWP